MAVGYRKRSGTVLFGLPLYDIAVGANPEAAEARGHARGIVAIGDIATGWLAIGGLSRGILAIGGLARGVVAVGSSRAGGCASAGSARACSGSEG